MSRRRVLPRRLATVLLAGVFAFGTASCSFLADEFSWLDTAGPVAEGAPDAPTQALADRP